MHDTAIATADPFVLCRDTLLHLPTGLAARGLAVGPSYWSHDADEPSLRDGRIVSVFDYDASWDWWERHPTGDEFLLLLSGDVELLLEDGTGRRAVRLAPAQGAIVPEGTWHRANVHGPSRMLFITPTPARTEQRPAGTT